MKKLFVCCLMPLLASNAIAQKVISFADGEWSTLLAKKNKTHEYTHDGVNLVINNVGKSSDYSIKEKTLYFSKVPNCVKLKIKGGFGFEVGMISVTLHEKGNKNIAMSAFVVDEDEETSISETLKGRNVDLLIEPEYRQEGMDYILKFVQPLQGLISIRKIIAYEAGKFANLQSISASEEEFETSTTISIKGENVYYTTDGTEPTVNSAKYTEPFTVSSSCTINAKGIYGETETEVKSINVVCTRVEKPQIKASYSQFINSSRIEIEAAEECEVYYSTDGEDPTVESQKYTEPFDVYQTCMIKAIAVKNGRYSEIETIEVTKKDVSEWTVANAVEWTTNNGESSSKDFVLLSFTNAVVILVDGNDYYIREGDVSIVIRFKANSLKSITRSFEVGDVISGSLCGKIQIIDNMPYFIEEDILDSVNSDEKIIVAEEKTTVEPVVTSIDELGDGAHVCDYVVLSDVDLKLSEGKYYATDGNVDILLSNISTDEDYMLYLYTIEGIVNGMNEGCVSINVLDVNKTRKSIGTRLEELISGESDNGVYDLYGRRTTHDSKGIHIQRGKKYVVK